MTESELVILLDDHGNVIGEAEKSRVHHNDTPLHAAFSCYLLDDSGRLLVTRRALTKTTWPGVWTNSFCGHPAPGESNEHAVHRRASHELGTQVRNLRSALPDFRYRAVDASGVVENEICPVFVANLDGTLKPSADEVSEWAWVSPSDLAAAVDLTPFAFSPWLVLQLPELISIEAFATGGPR